MIKNKLRSQRGASITFALLIFLVCSVVSIAVVIAGSAAAGRMSQRAETDQRYYAVASAVELLCDDFKDYIVDVEYTRPAGTTDVRNIVVNVLDLKGKDCGLLMDASKALVTKIANPDEVVDKTLTLTATNAPDRSALDCSIKEYVKTDGRVIFEVSNSAKDKGVYTLQAVLDANIYQTTSQYKVEDDAGAEKTMDKVTTELTWSVNGIVKGPVIGS